MVDSLLEYKASEWIDSSGKPISHCLVYDQVFVKVVVENPLRMRSTLGLIRVAIFKSGRLLPDVNVKQSKHVVTLPPLSSERIIVPFKPLYEAEYYYKVYIENKEVYAQPKGSPPRLYASKRESHIIVEKISEFSRNPGFSVAGKLIDAITGEGVRRARIEVYDARIFRNDKMLGYGTTDETGSFVIEGLRPFKVGSRIKIYLKFRGDDVYKPAASDQFIVNLA